MKRRSNEVKAAEVDGRQLKVEGSERKGKR